jgi:hypothetical protein
VNKNAAAAAARRPISCAPGYRMLL